MANNNVILSLALNASNYLLDRIIFSSNLEESDDEDEEAFIFLLGQERALRIRGQLNHPPRIKNYVRDVVPRFSNKQFQENFRMTPDAFTSLETLLGPLIFKENDGRPNIPVRKQLLSSIWIFATPDSYR